jgi:hypothetical protein
MKVDAEVMSMLRINVDEITAADIDALVQAQAPESATLDFKLTLTTDRDEFLKDISSFANGLGGHIVYGVREGDGKAAVVEGLTPGAVDQDVLRLQNIATSGGVDPRIPGLRFHRVHGFPGGREVVVVHIPRSWAGPHRVATSADSRFWARGSAGRFGMNSAQIRSAFLGTAEVPERLRRFRAERVSLIASGEAPWAVRSLPALIVHVVPLASIMGGLSIDLAAVAAQPPPCIGGSYKSTRYNIDGHLSYGGHSRGYAQVFRSGAIEALEADVGYEQDGARRVNVWGHEPLIVDSVGSYLRLLHRLGIEPPIAVLLTLLGARGATLPPTREERREPELLYAVDRDPVLIPDVEFQDLSEQPETVLRPAFDALWQAFGQPKSGCYDDAGTWHRDYRPRD